MTTPDLLSEIARLRVLVLGDAALDRWCHYNPALAEPSRETGLPRIAVIATETTPGAAGTVAWNAAALGARVTLLSAVGRDGHGFELERSLRERGIETHLVESPDLATFTYTKLINAHTGIEDLRRLDFINALPPGPDLDSEISRRFSELARDADVILVSDQAETAHGGLVTDRVRRALARVAAKQPQSTIWVDSRMRAERFSGVIVKGNRAEIESASQRLLGAIDFPELRRRLAAPLLVVTDGAAGARIVTENGAELVPSRQVEEPVDICGAGDSFSAAAALALRVTRDPVEAARFGHLAAGITVCKPGTGAASPEELLAAE